MNRFGLHFFQDQYHYSEKTIQTWLPVIKDLDIHWLVLEADETRAVPEEFIKPIIFSGLEPIVRIHSPLANTASNQEILALVNAYANWGVKYIVFFDQPNSILSWNAQSWVQSELIERFVDRFLAFARPAYMMGMKVVLPPLTPGGNYWDTYFLHQTLESLIRRHEFRLIDKLVLSAYAWTSGHSLDWGASGDKRGFADNLTEKIIEIEDQRGFHIADWYAKITHEILHKNLPIILFQAGLNSAPTRISSDHSSEKEMADRVVLIGKLLEGESLENPISKSGYYEPINENVIACNFWNITSFQHINSPYAWFNPDRSEKTIATCWKNWRMEKKGTLCPQTDGAVSSPRFNTFLLLPSYGWGISDWHWNVIRPFIDKHKPVIGFSYKEAFIADKVFAIGDEQAIPEEQLNSLRQSGCYVERICGDGTSIATILAER